MLKLIHFTLFHSLYLVIPSSFAAVIFHHSLFYHFIFCLHFSLFFICFLVSDFLDFFSRFSYPYISDIVLAPMLYYTICPAFPSTSYSCLSLHVLSSLSLLLFSLFIVFTSTSLFISQAFIYPFSSPSSPLPHSPDLHFLPFIFLFFSILFLFPFSSTSFSPSPPILISLIILHFTFIYPFFS